MNLDSLVQSVTDARRELQEVRDTSSPTYISDSMYRLAQYTSSLEELLTELEGELIIKESRFYKAQSNLKKSANAIQVAMKYEFPEERAQINKISRLVTSSWRLINTSQSRLRNLTEEGKNQF